MYSIYTVYIYTHTPSTIASNVVSIIHCWRRASA